MQERKLNVFENECFQCFPPQSLEHKDSKSTKSRQPLDTGYFGGETPNCLVEKMRWICEMPDCFCQDGHRNPTRSYCSWTSSLDVDVLWSISDGLEIDHRTSNLPSHHTRLHGKAMHLNHTNTFLNTEFLCFWVLIV